MTETGAGFFLIGDSHAVAIGDAALAAGRPFAGGPVAIGRALEKPFYTVEEDRFLLTTAPDDAFRDRFAGLLAFPGPILCALGFNSRRFGRDLHAFLDARGVAEWPACLSRQAFERCVTDARQQALAFYRLLAAHRREVYFVPSPQRTDLSQRQTLRDFEEVLIREVAATGARPVDVRDRLEDDGRDIAPRYRHPHDIAHGSAAYGQLVLDAFDDLRSRTRP